MADKNKSDRAARMAALRDKIKNQDYSGSGAGFWSPEQGANTIRILPEVGDMDFFFQPVGRHYFPPDGKKNCYCPHFTSEGELPCPVCELVEDLYKAGDKELAGQLRVRKQWWMNVINRKDEKSGPQIFTPGQTVFTAIGAFINDPDYGDILDLEDGLDIIVEREGEKLQTEYQVRTKRQNTPLAVDDDGEVDADTINAWLDKAKDLSYVVLSDDPDEDKELSEGHAVYVLPYERIVKEFNLDGDFDEPDEKPARKTTPAMKSTKRAVEPEEDDEAPRTRSRLRR